MADAAENLDLDTAPGDGPVRVNDVSAETLRNIIERIERLEADKKGIQEDISEVKKEAKGEGFDIKTINAILKLRKKDSRTIEEEELLLLVYKRALGMEE